VRTRATRDPALFGRDLSPPLLIEEIQYAPQLLSAVKQIADRGVPAGHVWMTGSQSFEVMHGVRETLAGRVAIINLLGLSDEEKGTLPATPSAFFSQVCETTFPRLFGIGDVAARDLYLSSYLQTYIERDVRELLGIEKRREFEVFVKMCALRTAQIVNYQDLARDAGISAPTAKEWLSLLEDSFLLRLVHPHYTNRTKRMVKSPKLYFLDAGLAAWLSGWREVESLRLGPMAGPLFETHVFGEMVRRFRHRVREVEISFWRTRDGQEIDFLVESGGLTFPIEVKIGLPDTRDLPALQRLRGHNWQTGTVISLAGGPQGAALSDDWRLAPEGNLGFLPA
jgi:predicted AAA+ superfamily ATPase